MQKYGTNHRPFYMNCILEEEKLELIKNGISWSFV
jgi:hypothetical protein